MGATWPEKSFVRRKRTAKVVLWCEFAQPTPKSDGKGGSAPVKDSLTRGKGNWKDRLESREDSEYIGIVNEREYPLAIYL